MYGMSERFEIRLNDEYLKKLSDLKAEYGTSTAAEAVRRAIDEAHAEARARRRRAALDRLLAMEGVEDVPDMDTLRRQLGRHPDYLQDDVADPH
jgi:hypothetical protein